MNNKAGLLQWGVNCVCAMLLAGCASPLTMAGRYPKNTKAFSVIVNDWIKVGEAEESVIERLREKGFHVRLATGRPGAHPLPYGIKDYLATYSQHLKDKTHLPLMVDRHAVWYVRFKVAGDRVREVTSKYGSTGMFDL